MKINIGPHTEWLGPYQLAEKILFWMDKYDDDYDNDKDPIHSLGEFFAHGFHKKTPEDEDKLSDSRPNTWLYELLLKLDKRKKRKIEIHIDKYDTWNIDATLSMIIVPMLKQLRESAQGYPANFVYEDQSFSDQLYFEGPGFEFPDDGQERWHETLDKMIWAFEQSNEDWEDQYRTGKIDLRFVPTGEVDHRGHSYSTLEKGPDHTLVTDYDGMAAHQERMQEGYDLFAKYYRNLWD